MTPAQPSAGEWARQMAGPGLALRTGPFNVRLRCDIASVHQAVSLLYDANPVVDDAAFCDFALDIVRCGGLRRWIKPQVRLFHDGVSPFEPLPGGHAFALFEWSMNWCISNHAHQYLLLHAAVVERNGCAAILPAPPGSGKSTLCAGLTQRGWRLLSDELALIELSSGLLWPLARPVSLKNESIDIIRKFEPSAVFSEETRDTNKGTVAHMKAKREDVARMSETARPCWVIFPRYVPDAPPTLVPRLKPEAMMDLGTNAFNYDLLGLGGFEALANLIEASDCYNFNYSQLDDAVQVFDTLALQHGA